MTDWPGENYRDAGQGVPLLVCKRCGSVVLYGSVDEHDEWHEWIEALA